MDHFKFSPGAIGSPYANQLRKGFSALRFDGPLEKEFRDFYVAQVLPRARLSALIAIIIVLAVTSLDLALGAHTNGMINVLRLGVLCPMLIIVGVAISLPTAARYYTPLAAVSVVVAGTVAIYIAHLATIDGAAYVLAGLVLVVLYACLFLGLLFNVATTASALLISAHALLGSYLGVPPEALYYATAMLCGAAVVGGLSTYNLEHALRTNFLEMLMLNELAERDGMTGLYNRRIFDDYVQRIWRQSRRETVALAVIFVDIDSFKVFNDLYGHQAGDDCLKRVADCIARGAKRPFDFAARYGGEEFVLVLYGPPEDYARMVVEQIRRDVADLAIPHAGSRAAKSVTVSLGMSLTRPGSARSLAGAIQTADEALYQAKQEGCNRAVFKDPDDSGGKTGTFRVIRRDLG